jgi:formamidopyrimidine-DNA glycosylase
MPELPEVEVLVRELSPLLRNKTIRRVSIGRPRVTRPTPVNEMMKSLAGAKILALKRRAKYLVFDLRLKDGKTRTLLGHLGMTGRMYLAPGKHPLPKHAAAVFELGAENFIFEDTRYFGRMTFDLEPLRYLGPEPLGREFTAEKFLESLKRSAQPIKVKLLDQCVVAGIGNLYASEALFRAKLSPRIPAKRLTKVQSEKLRRAIQKTLEGAIRCGSTIAAKHRPGNKRAGLFYFAQSFETETSYARRLWVYDRAGEPCRKCKTLIRKFTQSARTTFYCPRCQRD